MALAKTSNAKLPISLQRNNTRDYDETDSLYNKKTFETTDMDFTNLDGGDGENRDLIYENTKTNDKPITRVIVENPVLSNLFFQMLLFYNFFYFWLQFFIFFTMMINKLWVFDYMNYRDYIAYGCIIFYFPLELCSCYFGYMGNINEAFPQLVAFFIFTVFFRVPIVLGIYIQNFLFPLEYSCFYITAFFYIAEFIFGIITTYKIIKTQTALFYLRNAPLVDKKFNKMMRARDNMNIKSSREIATGIKSVKHGTHFENKWLKEPEWMTKDYHSFDRTSHYDVRSNL